MPKARNLKYFREKEGLTQQKIADILGVTRATIVSWEKHRHAIPEPAARRIAKWCKISYHDFCNKDFFVEGCSLTDDEIKQVLRFRKIDETAKAMIRASLETAYELVKDKYGESPQGSAP